MAAEVGMEAAAVTPSPGAVERRLRERPTEFEFFQAVRLLGRLSPGRAPVGGFAHPGDELVRFAAAGSAAFPASQIQALEPAEGAPARMTVNFMGLTGPLGVLPLVYTLLAAERGRAHDGALGDFLDIFNHRLVSLFYAAWERYRFPVAHERDGDDRLTRHLADLVGLGTEGVRGRLPVPDESLLPYAGLLASGPRSAVGLRQLLADYFAVPVEVEQFVGGWYPLAEETRCLVGRDRDDSSRLGRGAVVGD